MCIMKIEKLKSFDTLAFKKIELDVIMSNSI
ncbi:hypothetical protein SAMN05518672_1011425 [Chitinophaga sp. CF118]|nr:hypothetical protein SAMN05518672_1011425 [Chitinophaga sp. CF118]